MKVAFSTFFTPETGGGDARIAYEIPQAFAKSGHKALLIHPDQSAHTTFEENYTAYTIPCQTKNNVVVPKIGNTTIKNIFAQLSQFQPDIIHAQDPGPTSLICQIWAQKNNVPFITTLHVLPTKIKFFGAKDTSAILDKLFDSKIFSNYFENFLKNCQAVITLNKEAQEDLQKFGFNGKTFTIPNGRDLSRYKKLPIKSLQEKPINLIFVGFLSERKNQLFLLKAFKKLTEKSKKFQLHLVGETLEKNYYQRLKGYCRENNLDNVNFWGRVPHEKVIKLLGKSHIFVSASTMEVQSLVILEALAAGKPVVGLANETTRQLLNDKVGCLLPAKTSPVEFAQKVNKISNLGDKKYRQMAQTARQKVEDFDWPKVVKKTVAAYKEIIANKEPVGKSHWQNVFPKNKKPLKKVMPQIGSSYQWLVLIPLIAASYVGRQIIKFSKTE